jgi:hypothetical protein
MGQRIFDCFARADQLAGIQGRIRLATLTRVNSTQAMAEPDTPVNLKKFEDALAQIRQDFAGAPDTLRNATAEDPAKALARLRTFNSVFVELMTQRAQFLGNMEKTNQRVTEAAASTLDVARASIWLYDDARTLIRCSDLFERAQGKHSSGIELSAKDFPVYFKALEAQQTIAAHDAHNDPRTFAFSKPYLTPLGINSMLDVPIWASGKMLGVVCHEHIGPPRRWQPDEESFAYLMAGFVALASENAR